MNHRALGLHWDLPQDRIFFNHGSFGLAPRELLHWRFQLLREIECDPVDFLVEQLPVRLAAARYCLADLVGASAEQLAFVPSTTYGLNELLQRLDLLEEYLPSGSEILLPDHGYNATTNLVRFAAERHGWQLRFVPIPWPLSDPSQVVEAFERLWTRATRLLVIDHITSPSALVMPLQELIELARSRQALVIVDGAHAPGLLPLQLDQLGADAYVGNLHKWLCCPRGSAFLWVCRRWQERLRPLVISHGANAPANSDVSRFRLEHDWIGTADPTPWLALPEALRLLGWIQNKPLRPAMALNQRLAERAGKLISQALLKAGVAHGQGTTLAAPLAMVSIQLPQVGCFDGGTLQKNLFSQGFQLPVIPVRPYMTGVPQFLRISCFDYNTNQDLDLLAAALPKALRGLSAG
ncbi:aminotransferase class V-fold PLP-dependent enzyme [Cyanobium sp. HWJ4-Hawea]|uniref:aminotransferase class V-fold PLP-dependent enzyme n=1 Tax=Cyanobium sp. HWJ4-Hawea TaxID=2823713 RepID=UPI0020CC12CB|nr:aminotransferase class V-fold PLP-dependent enzyme [Cyanobium sp. HWJ4-Hawea]MCP9808632.1 aminotransferase class V-fold PLP-dependent enzyme [Cyanobium sp. HWJ4-Hawea]